MESPEKPIDIIGGNLCECMLPEMVAETIIADLEDAGWRLVWCGDVRSESAMGEGSGG